MRLPSLAEMRKAGAAVGGVAAMLIAQGVLHGTAEHVVEAVLAVLTAVGVYQVPNGPKSAQ